MVTNARETGKVKNAIKSAFPLLSEIDIDTAIEACAAETDGSHSIAEFVACLQNRLS